MLVNVIGPAPSPRDTSPAPVCCQPWLASPLQISSTGRPSSPLTLERAHIVCKRAAAPLCQCFSSKPAQICHSLRLFLPPPATTAFYLQPGCFPGRLAHTASYKWCSTHRTESHRELLSPLSRHINWYGLWFFCLVILKGFCLHFRYAEQYSVTHLH